MNQIVAQAQEPADEADVNELRSRMRREKEEVLRKKCDNLKRSLPQKMQRVVEPGGEKEMSFDLNKKEFRDAIRLHYDWHILDTQSVCICDVCFTVDHMMICNMEAQ